MKIVCSACLLGHNCKYNGGNNFSQKLDRFIHDHDCTVIPVCPEVMGGLSTPRIPCEIRNGRVYNREGQDVHDAFVKGAETALEIVRKEEPDLIVLMSRSPSCGSRQIYDGTFTGTGIPGQGIFVKMLKKEGFEPTDIEEL
ncbi:MAG: DUF523 domain-containing protein [Bulleidia sp.]